MMDFKKFLNSTNNEVISENTEYEIFNLYHHRPDISMREIANKTGLSIGSIYRTLQKGYGYIKRKKSPKTEHIMQLHQAGVDKNTIAQTTGYSPRHIERIIKGK